MEFIVLTQTVEGPDDVAEEAVLFSVGLQIVLAPQIVHVGDDARETRVP